MKYALISDIHGNIHALDAVLADARKNGIDKYIFLGDYFLNIPYPNKTVDRLINQKNAYFVKGNEEEYLDKSFDAHLWKDNGQFSALYHTYKALNPDSISFLKTMSTSLTIHDEYFDIFMFHSPNDLFENTYLNQVTPYKITMEKEHNSNVLSDAKSKLLSDIQLQEVVKTLPKGIYTFGHNHIQMHVEIEGSLLINPGSCGLPLDFSPAASYTILETSSKGFSVTEKKVDYDLERLVKIMKQTELFDNATVWFNVIIEELQTSRTVVIPFLIFMEEYAKSIGDNVRPFTYKTWEDGYMLWENRID